MVVLSLLLLLSFAWIVFIIGLSQRLFQLNEVGMLPFLYFTPFSGIFLQCLYLIFKLSNFLLQSGLYLLCLLVLVNLQLFLLLFP
jgi:hypothetical protein